MGYLQHLRAEQLEALRRDVRAASDEAYGDRATLQAETELATRGLAMSRRTGGIRVYRANAPGSLPLAMLPDADAVLTWLAENPPP